ncbi:MULTISPECIES: Uma2 family endonuclease [Cohnella]|uniref:Uma2 family endonuclease n=1 Tax=Cohnella phaseoli TaxID=456490 RepID=A0A3D9JPP5_9BACL|nr:Uma2 family endonuclease [Cohnella phaseoli]RED75769.1 Uma2 family endonuclease [Cohnella phaseoli]
MAMDDRLFKQRSEMINGVTIMMSPRPVVNHNKIIVNLSILFGVYLKGKRCINLSDGVDVHLDEQNRVVPDSMIICNRDIIKRDGVYGAPDLIVEVLSPSTARRDRGDKKILYEQHGVQEYWIISPDEKSVEVYLLKDGKYELDDVYTVIPDGDWEEMTEEEKSEVALNLKVSLYDDFIINVKDVFENVITY